jgi:predicted DNA-binding mobile mystery protein A
MEKSKRTAQSRAALDKRFRDAGSVMDYKPPVQGWIRAIRDALGMSAAQLAQRLGVRQPTVTTLEQSESKGTIELASLRRAAEALDCRLVYALVPNKPLDAIIREKARAFAHRRFEPIEHSMLLEDQKVAGQSPDRFDEILRETNPRLFWD